MLQYETKSHQSDLNSDLSVFYKFLSHISNESYVVPIQSMIQTIDQLAFNYYFKLVIKEDQQNVDFSYDKFVNFVNFSLKFEKQFNFDKAHL